VEGGEEGAVRGWEEGEGIWGWVGVVGRVCCCCCCALHAGFAVVLCMLVAGGGVVRDLRMEVRRQRGVGRGVVILMRCIWWVFGHYGEVVIVFTGGVHVF
jgi:hypothetical protein